MAIDQPTRVLVVADWTVEATDVVAECRWRSERDPALSSECTGSPACRFTA
jgi:hypothetical protein